MDFLTIAQTLGVAVACLVSLGTAVWAALRWAAKHVLKPLVDAHVIFLRGVQKNLDRQTELMEEETSHRRRHSDILDKMQKNQEELTKLFSEVHRQVVQPKKVHIETQSVTMTPAPSAPTGRSGHEDSPGD